MVQAPMKVENFVLVATARMTCSLRLFLQLNLIQDRDNVCLVCRDISEPSHVFLHCCTISIFWYRVASMSGFCLVSPPGVLSMFANWFNFNALKNRIHIWRMIFSYLVLWVMKWISMDIIYDFFSNKIIY